MKTVIATIVLSALSALSFAEATEFTVPAATLSRVEVLASASADRSSHGESNAQRFAQDLAVRGGLSRAQVMADTVAYRAMRHAHGESNALRFASAQDSGTNNPVRMADARTARRFGDANRSDFNQPSH